MQRWEYKVVDAGTIRIGNGKKKLDRVSEGLLLDQDVDWFEQSWSLGSDWRFADVARSDGDSGQP